MSYAPANVVRDDPVHLSTYGRNGMGGAWSGHTAGTPASGVWSLANRAYYQPFYLAKGYSLARWWWANGATVGTNYLQAGIYDESFNLFRASPMTLSAGTAARCQYANPGIHGTNVIGNLSSTDLTSYTTASVTMKAGVMYLLAVANGHASSAPVVSSIDNGPTFTSRSSTQTASALTRVSIWSAVPTTDYTGTLVINFGASTQTACAWSLNAFYHADTATTHGVVQQATGTGTSTTPLATLGAFGSANNATFGAFGSSASTTGAPSTGYIELSDSSPTGASLHTVFRPDNDTTVDETITSNPWGACAVEIKSLGTSAVYVPPMRGYLALWCNGTTATIFRQNTADVLSYTHYMQTSTAGLPATATPTAIAAGAEYSPLHGITSRSSP